VKIRDEAARLQNARELRLWKKAAVHLCTVQSKLYKPAKYNVKFNTRCEVIATMHIQGGPKS